MHDIFRQSFGNEALFFCACFSARRCIKICKNQKYYLTYLRNSKKIYNFAHSFSLWEFEAVILHREKFNAHGNEEKT